MCQFIETIRAEKGKYWRTDLHNARMNNTGHSFFREWKEIDLNTILPNASQYQLRTKVRVEYGRNGIITISGEPYRVRRIESLILVNDNTIEYGHKSTNRDRLNYLRAHCKENEEIIIVKNGYLTDTSYTNIALWDGYEWHTPSRPLLQGTMRKFLLNKGLIIPREIRPCELSRYKKISLFNAMIDFKEIEIEVRHISPSRQEKDKL